MMNLKVISTFNSTNTTSQNSRLFVSLAITLITFTVITFLLFIYLILVLLNVYFTTPHVRENARYILFAHMLINDTMYLSLALFFCLANAFQLTVPVHICYFLVTLAVMTFRVTPYNLAIMALERYVAICFPLRHVMLCTVRRSYFLIAAMWFLGLFPQIIDFIFLSSTVQRNFFFQSLACKQNSVLIHPVQSTIQSFSFIATLISVALVILLTYIKVTLVARKTGSRKSSTSKAGKTLMLHAFQLMLCLLSLTYFISESSGGDYYLVVAMLNFLVFMCLPRVLSPLIYGIRDEVFSKSIRRMYSTNCNVIVNTEKLKIPIRLSIITTEKLS